MSTLPNTVGSTSIVEPIFIFGEELSTWRHLSKIFGEYFLTLQQQQKL